MIKVCVDCPYRTMQPRTNTARPGAILLRHLFVTAVSSAAVFVCILAVGRWCGHRLTLYRTHACTDLSFSDSPLPLTALASFPGSGNTWLRHLVQQSTGKTRTCTCVTHLFTGKTRTCKAYTYNSSIHR